MISALSRGDVLYHGEIGHMFVAGIVLGVVSLKMAAPDRVVTEAAVSPPMPEPAAPEPEAPAEEGEGDVTGGAMV